MLHPLDISLGLERGPLARGYDGLQLLGGLLLAEVLRQLLGGHLSSLGRAFVILLQKLIQGRLRWFIAALGLDLPADVLVEPLSLGEVVVGHARQLQRPLGCCLLRARVSVGAFGVILVEDRASLTDAAPIGQFATFLRELTDDTLRVLHKVVAARLRLNRLGTVVF